jgi:hypothetical protein
LTVTIRVQLGKQNGVRETATWGLLGAMNAKRVSILTASLVLAGTFWACGGVQVIQTASSSPRLQLTADATKALSPGALARRDAVQLLSRVRLPRGSKRVAGQPSGDGNVLSSPAQQVADPNLVDLHRFYVVAEDSTDVYAYVQSHRPAGSTLSGSGTGANASSTDQWFVSYGWPPIKTVLDTRTLVISIAALPDDRSGIRVDARVTWLPAKPAGDLIGKGATVLTAVLSKGLNPGEAGHLPVTTADPRKIEAIRDFINSLGVVAPGVRMCPVDFGQYLTISFSKSAGAVPFDVVVADTSGCQEVQVQHFGHAVEPELWGPQPGLVPFVERELSFS